VGIRDWLDKRRQQAQADLDAEIQANEDADREALAEIVASLGGLSDRGLLAVGARNLRRVVPRYEISVSNVDRTSRTIMAMAEYAAGLSNEEPSSLQVAATQSDTLVMCVGGAFLLLHNVVHQAAALLREAVDRARQGQGGIADAIAHSLLLSWRVWEALCPSCADAVLRRACAHDCQQLRALAGRRMSNGAPVAEGSLGTLWPEGAPSGWPQKPES